MDESKLTRRELTSRVRAQGVTLLICITGLVLLIAALVRKGVLKWGDLLPVEDVSG